MHTVQAIEIDSHETWNMLCALNPLLKELDAEFNQGFFIVVTPESGAEGAIMSPATVAEYFDHIEPNEHRIKIVTLVK